jgi:hypothetical protein
VLGTLASTRFLKLMLHVAFNAAIRSHSLNKFAVESFNRCSFLQFVGLYAQDIFQIGRVDLTTGFSIRKWRGDGWEAKALACYQTVLDDLTLIFGPDYSLLFDAELGRKPNIKLPTGGKNPKFLIVHACETLENRMKQDLMESHITHPQN